MTVEKKVQYWKRMKELFRAAVLSAMFFVAIPNDASAAIVPACALGYGGCGMCDFFVLAGNLGSLILDLSSIVVVFSIVIGGIFWVTSFGNAERIDKGKQIIMGGIIGLCIVFFAFTLVNLVLFTLTYQNEKRGLPEKIGVVMPFGDDPWNDFCEETAPATNAGTVDNPYTTCNTHNEGGACTSAICTDASSCLCSGNQCLPKK